MEIALKYKVKQRNTVNFLPRIKLIPRGESPGEEVGLPVVSSGDLWSFFRTPLCKGNRNEPFVSCMMGKLE